MPKETSRTLYPEYTRLALVIGLVLATIYTVLDFFTRWIASPITLEVIGVWVLAITALLIIFPMICYLSSLVWTTVIVKPTA